MLKCVVAELVSAYSTGGGMYFVVKHVVPPESVASCAWVSDGVTFCGKLLASQGVADTVSRMMLAAVSMNSGRLKDREFSYPRYLILL